MLLFGPPKGKETLLHYLTKYMPQFVISSVAGIIYNTAIVLGPIFLGRLLDAAGGGNGQKVLLSAIYLVGVTALFQFARFVKRWYMRDQFNRVACDLRQTFVERILGRRLPELEQETVGDLMSRTVGDITLVVDTVMSTLNEGWDTWLLMISYFVVLMFRDWRITLLASVMVPVTIALAQRMRHVLYQYSMSARRAASSSNGGLYRYLDGVAVLRLFGREEAESEDIQGAFAEQSRFNIKEILLQQALLPIYALIAGLGVVVVVALGGHKVKMGEWTVGGFNAYLVMFIAFSGRTRVAARVFNRWHAARASWSRVQEKMNKQSVPPQTGFSQSTECQTLKVSNLTFGLGGNDTLKGISLTAHKGQIIGITGAVGSGKTTLAHALTGLYPYEGSIALDNMELDQLSEGQRRDLVAYTGHEQFLFSMSIEENILFAGEGRDVNRLERALSAAALTHDLARFDDGLETKVGEKGVRVSGGQRQRIALARAIYSDASILLLDDPFSAVDIATEKEIIDHLKDEYRDRMVLLFTHRLTAFKHVDSILVLDQGRIAEQGTHAELMDASGLYAEIFSAQVFMEGENNEQAG